MEVEIYSQTQFLDNIDGVEPIQDASTKNQVMELLQFVASYKHIKMSIEEIKAIPMKVLEEAWLITSGCTDKYGNRTPDDLLNDMVSVELIKDNLISIQSKFVADDDDFF